MLRPVALALASSLLMLLVVSSTIAPSRACAQASSQRVILVAIDPELTRAATRSLAPWGLEIVSTPGDAPASMPLAEESARAIATAQSADAVVWISASESGPALWVYDAESERSLVRALTSSPPFDEPTAAAVALTLKTLLRHSMVAPVAERAALPVPPAPPSPRIFQVELGGGLAAFATSPGDVEPRVSLAASLWPAELSGIVGLSIGARAGPGISVRGEGASGRWTSTLLALGVRFRWDLGLVDLGAGLEAGTVITTLDVELGASRHASVVRAGFGGAGWAEVGVRPDPALRLGLRGGVTVSLPFERYLQRGVLLLDVSPVALLAELVVSISF